MQVNASKRAIQDMRGHIEHARMKAAAAMIAEGREASDATLTPEEESLRHAIEEEKTTYRECFDALKEIKKEIEHIQMLLERSRKQLQSDFDQWIDVMTRRNAAAGGQPSQAALDTSAASAATTAYGAGAAPGPRPPGPPPLAARPGSRGGPAAIEAVPGSQRGLSVTGSGGASAVYDGVHVLGGAPVGGHPAAFVGDASVDADIARFYEASRGMKGAR